ncbi:FMN-dependent alpha-hydroxy acid dehydrogenase [Thozetella sp. PMI_491]|nr:FMN-dependent alpha-hydroxy acid dehydrogenase [Thozetella sp. PMI_491]
MPNSHDGNDGHEPKPPYSQYQIDIYINAILNDSKVPLTTDPNKLEAAARKVMPAAGFGYVFGGAGEQSTMHANRLAFRQWKLIPRFLRPAIPRDLKVELFGKTYETPVLMGPVGAQSEYHKAAEPGTAIACAELDVPFIISTASSVSMEDIAAAADAAYTPSSSSPTAPRWYQLYWPLSDEITASILRRAKAAGCSVLVVTLDTFSMAWRPTDLDAGFLPMAVGVGNANGFSDPVFRRRVAEATDGETPEENPILASRMWTSDVFSGNAHRWEDLATLRKMWDGPIVLKGVLSVADALLAAQHGMDGIIVSNHGGRQLDGAVPSLEMLPEIVDAVGNQLTVLFDSGVRTGADIMKALALGAKAVLVGRPVIYGLGIAGKDGAKHVLAGLLADLDQSMGLSGVQKISELNRGVLRKVQYGGDIHSNL